VHSSHHGSWISDNPGHSGKGLPIESIQPSSSANKRLQAYMFRPQENMNNTFHATFTGVTSCNENGVPVLNVRQVEQIEIGTVRDAA
jgi:hypothetical protein